LYTFRHVIFVSTALVNTINLTKGAQRFWATVHHFFNALDYQRQNSDLHIQKSSTIKFI